MSLNIQALVSRYVNKIEVIGHKKSLIVEVRLHATGEEQYRQLFDALSNLNLDNIAEMAMVAQSKLSALGVNDEVMEKAEKEVKSAKK
jgi:mevalonate kinase